MNLENQRLNSTHNPERFEKRFKNSTKEETVKKEKMKLSFIETGLKSKERNKHLRMLKF